MVLATRTFGTAHVVLMEMTTKAACHAESMAELARRNALEVPLSARRGASSGVPIDIRIELDCEVPNRTRVAEASNAEKTARQTVPENRARVCARDATRTGGTS